MVDVSKQEDVPQDQFQKAIDIKTTGNNFFQAKNYKQAIWGAPAPCDSALERYSCLDQIVFCDARVS